MMCEMNKQSLINRYLHPRGFSLVELLVYLAIFGLVGTTIWAGISTFILKQNKVMTLQELTNEANFSLRRVSPLFSNAQAFVARTKGFRDVDAGDAFDDSNTKRNPNGYTKNCLDIVYNDGTSTTLWLQENPGDDAVAGYYAFFSKDEAGCAGTLSTAGSTQLSDYIFVVRDITADGDAALFEIDAEAPGTVRFNLNVASINADRTTVTVPLNQSESIDSRFFTGDNSLPSSSDCHALIKKQDLSNAGGFSGPHMFLNSMAPSTKFEGLYIHITNYNSLIDVVHANAPGRQLDNVTVSGGLIHDIETGPNGNTMNHIMNILDYIVFDSATLPRTLHLKFYAQYGKGAVYTDPSELENGSGLYAGEYDVDIYLEPTGARIGEPVANDGGVQCLHDYLEGPPGLSVVDRTVFETGSSIPVTINLSRAADGNVTFDWETTADTATDGVDYTGDSGTITIEAGATTATVSVGIIADALDEEVPETFGVTISNPRGATISQSVGVVTIHGTSMPNCIYANNKIMGGCSTSGTCTGSGLTGNQAQNAANYVWSDTLATGCTQR